jgi:hypothetical protein
MKLQRIFVLLLSTLVFASALLHPRQDSSSEFNYTIDGIAWWKGWYGSLPGMEPSQKPWCWERINDLLNKTSEFDKLASAASVGLLTLLPTFLAFSPVPMPSISNLMILSPLAAFVMAGMTLGIPAHSIEPSYRVLKARDLAPDEHVVSLGISGPEIGRTQHCRASRRNEIHQWYTGNPNLTAIRRRVLQYKTPCLGKGLSVGRSTLYSYLFCLIQIGGMVILYVMSLNFMGSYIWTCSAESSDYHLSWILLSFMLATPFYGISAVFHRDTEYTFYLSPLPEWVCLPSDDLTAIPNRVPEWEERRPFGFKFKLFSFNCPKLSCPKFSRPRAIRNRFKKAFKKSWEDFRLLLQSQTPSTIVIRRVSTTGGTATPQYISLIGTLRGFVLIILTFLYASSYGGTLHNTLMFVAVLFGTISFSRILGTILLLKLQDAANFTVIECSSSTEVRGMMRLLTVIPGVVISKRGCKLRFSGGLCIEDFYKNNEYIERRTQWHMIFIVLPLLIAALLICQSPFYFFDIYWTGAWSTFMAVATLYICGVLMSDESLQRRGAWASILAKNGIYMNRGDVAESTALEAVVVDNSSSIQQEEIVGNNYL